MKHDHHVSKSKLPITLCWGDPFDLVPLPVESWLGRLELDCLVLDLPRVAVFAGLAFVVLTDPELPPLLLGDEFAEFLPFCVWLRLWYGSWLVLGGRTEALDVHLLKLEHFDLGIVEHGDRCRLELLGVEFANKLEESPLAWRRCRLGSVADRTELESSHTWKLACDWARPSIIWKRYSVVKLIGSLLSSSRAI